MSTTTMSAPTPKTTIAEKLAQAHEIAQLAMARIKARAAILTEKALDNLEMILDSRPDCPETIRRAAVNILSILGVPTAPTKAPPATEFCPPESADKKKSKEADEEESNFDENGVYKYESPWEAPPQPATIIALTESLEKVNLRAPFTKDQCEKIAEAISNSGGDFKPAYLEIWNEILNDDQAKLLEHIIAGDPVLPPDSDAPPPPHTLTSFLTPPRVNPCQSSEVLSPTPKDDPEKSPLPIQKPPELPANI